MKHLILLILLVLVACSNNHTLELLDTQATQSTKNLYSNLYKIQQSGDILFGQQDATLYGRTWSGDENRSDVKDLCGSHPAVIGLDFIGVTTPDTIQRALEKSKLIKAVQETRKRGGIVTFAWHASNPANDGSFYWKEDSIRVVSDLLEGGKLHEKYKHYLQLIADVASNFKDENNQLIPVIFRPFHEFDGDWFWWGKGHCTKDDFIALWQFTVHYLKDTLNIHHFIYAFSPDCRFTTEKEYLDYYPGDQYVDLLGFDDYWDFRPDGTNDPQLVVKKLKIISDIATAHHKLAALTETGLEGIPQNNWFTKTLYPTITQSKICYVLVWRNAYQSPTHYYAPTIGHPAATDFIQFYKKKNILFEDRLPSMY